MGWEGRERRNTWNMIYTDSRFPPKPEAPTGSVWAPVRHLWCVGRLDVEGRPAHLTHEGACAIGRGDAPALAPGSRHVLEDPQRVRQARLRQ